MPQRRALFRHLNFQKWSNVVCFVHFDLEMCFAPQRKVVRQWCALYILTSKYASRHNGVHFFDISPLHFHFEMCFAPQRRALFRHRNFQKWSGVLCILTCTCASRHNGFSEPTFRPSGAPNHWKNTVFRDFPTFSRICIFFLLTLSLLLLFLLIFLFSLPLPCSAFHLSILSEV